MGSFSEAVMRIRLRGDMPDEALAAISRLGARPTGRHERDGGSVPPLPKPHSEQYDDDLWEEDPSELERSPWLYDWSLYLKFGMWTAYIEGENGASLAWNGKSWLLSFRTTQKIYPSGLAASLAWMGRFAQPPQGRHPELVGYLMHEDERRPWLIWNHGRRALEFEDPNGSDDREDE